jgi:hypothetical protein
VQENRQAMAESWNCTSPIMRCPNQGFDRCVRSECSNELDGKSFPAVL